MSIRLSSKTCQLWGSSFALNTELRSDGFFPSIYQGSLSTRDGSRGRILTNLGSMWLTPFRSRSSSTSSRWRYRPARAFTLRSSAGTSTFDGAVSPHESLRGLDTGGRHPCRTRRTYPRLYHRSDGRCHRRLCRREGLAPHCRCSRC